MMDGNIQVRTILLKHAETELMMIAMQLQVIPALQPKIQNNHKARHLNSRNQALYGKIYGNG